MYTQEILHHEHKIEVPVKCLEGRLYLRVSAHIYNTLDQYQHLAHTIKTLK
jgi:selenocysteine lyase/cysteine desulfurase